MTWLRGLASWARATGVELVGWLLVVTGIAALVLPGPGLLMMVAGLAVLSNRYEWAERRVEPIKVRAFDAARFGVRTWPRIGFSILSAVVVMAFGVIWWVGPEVPEVGPLEDELPIIGEPLPFSGWATGLSMMLSSLIALALIAYSVARFRYGDDSEVRDPREDEVELDERGLDEESEV